MTAASPGERCRGCHYWRKLRGVGCYTCHYRLDNDEGLPTEDGRCRGYEPKGKYRPQPLSLGKRKE